MTGADLLDDVETFLGRFVAYPTEHARVAHVLWIAHAHFMGSWESTPRIAFLSPEPGSGKSRALEVTEPLVPRPVHAVNTTPAYLFRKVSDPDGLPTILYDEVDTVFGIRAAKDSEDVRAMLNAGHRRGATAGRCVVKGHVVLTEELPAYCAVALAGLHDIPDTIATRSVIVRMRRRAPDEHVEPWRLRIHGPAAAQLRERLEAWASTEHDLITWPDMPAGLVDRAADVWEALLAVADLAGGEWPERARRGAVALVADTQGGQGSIGVQLLRDLHTLFEGRDRLTTDTLLELLHGLEEAPWGDYRGKPVDSRWLAKQLRRYGVHPAKWRDGTSHGRGYLATDLADPWARYVVADVADVADPQGDEGGSVADVAPPLWTTSEEVKTDATPSPHKEAATSATPPHDQPPCINCYGTRDQAALLTSDTLCTTCRTKKETGR